MFVCFFPLQKLRQEDAKCTQAYIKIHRSARLCVCLILSVRSRGMKGAKEGEKGKGTSRQSPPSSCALSPSHPQNLRIPNRSPSGIPGVTLAA